MANDKELTIFEHLAEFRSRLVVAGIALIVGTAISMVFATQALQILILPLGDQIPQTIHPTESFIVYFRVALIGGVTISMPVLVYVGGRCILAGLFPEEKKYLYFLLPGATFCFAAGVAFAALVMLPAAINFMQGFMQTIIDNRWTLDNYIAFVTRVLFWIGLVFETPLVMFFLAKLNIITAQKLAKARKFAILGIAVIAAAVTPTPDPVNMMIMMVPLYLLYEVGVILARVAVMGRKKEATAAS